mmetsp:Transcript_28652/g.66440  ORF Transcript_28652/g.66440 Transcript_28652/m.66440 type:complete len:350 (-) Transcript_28652:21-1070(-)
MQESLGWEDLCDACALSAWRLGKFFENAGAGLAECVEDGYSYSKEVCVKLQDNVTAVVAPAPRAAGYDGTQQRAAAAALASSGAAAVAGDGARCMQPPLQSPPSMWSFMFPGFRTNSVLFSISALQCAAFAASLSMGSAGLIPTECTLYTLGASFGPAIAHGEVWRLFAPIWLHTGLNHLLPNLFLQLRVGFALEAELGRSRFTLIYLLAGVIGNLVSAAVFPVKLSVGASTSALGLFGANIALFALDWNRHGSAQRLQWIVIVLLMVLFQGLVGGTDVWGHVAGLLAGFCLTLLLAPERTVHPDMPPAWQRLSSMCSLSVLAAAVCASASVLIGLDPASDVLASACSE